MRCLFFSLCCPFVFPCSLAFFYSFGCYCVVEVPILSLFFICVVSFRVVLLFLFVTNAPVCAVCFFHSVALLFFRFLLFVSTVCFRVAVLFNINYTRLGFYIYLNNEYNSIFEYWFIIVHSHSIKYV